MKLLHFKTREQWLDWRDGKIGSSDAPIIMDCVEWGNPEKLWLLKKKKIESNPPNFAMRRGLRLEGRALEAYSEKKGVEFRKVWGENERHPWMSASIDGITEDLSYCVEMKCPGKVDHAIALAGDIPEKYKWQCAHILMLTNHWVMDYFSFDGKNGVIVEYRRDLSRERILFEAEKRFVESLSGSLPPQRRQPLKITSEMGFQEKLAVIRGGKK